MGVRSAFRICPIMWPLFATPTPYRWRGGSSKMAEETGIDSPGYPVRLLADAVQRAKNDLFVYKCEAVREGSYYR